MPVDVVRMRDCRLALNEDAEVYKAGSMLWWAAWHQVPAGSLPNNERQLCLLAGLGKAVSKWRTIQGCDEQGRFETKRLSYALANGACGYPTSRENSGGIEAEKSPLSGGKKSGNGEIPVETPPYFGHVWAINRGALSHFVLCSDGRLYHPLIAEVAVRQWNSLARENYMRDYDRIRKNNQTRVKRGDPPVRILPPAAVQMSWLNLALEGDQEAFETFRRKPPVKVAIELNYTFEDGRVLPISNDGVSKNRSIRTPRVLKEVTKKDSVSDITVFQTPSLNNQEAQVQVAKFDVRAPQVEDRAPLELTSKPGPAQREESAAKDRATVDTWKAYADAYYLRYGIEPIRNATVNSQLALLVKRVGRSHAPLVAAFYVTMNHRFYVEKAHAVGPLVKDAEAIYSQCVRNAPMTSAQARQVDRTDANRQAFGKMIEDAEKREGPP